MNLFVTDFMSIKELFADNFRFVKEKKQYCRLFREIPIYAISSLVWLAWVVQLALWSYLKSRFQSDDEKNRFQKLIGIRFSGIGALAPKGRSD